MGPAFVSGRIGNKAECAGYLADLRFPHYNWAKLSFRDQAPCGMTKGANRG